MQSNNKKTIEINTNKSNNVPVDELLDKNRGALSAALFGVGGIA